MDGQGTTGDKARIRRSLLVSAAMLLIAFSVFGGLFYLQRQAASQDESKERYWEEDPEVIAKREQTALERARLLRDKWRPWAVKHEALLKRMLKAKPDDRATLMAVWDAIPKYPENGSGITSRLLRPSGRHIEKDVRSGQAFSWAAISKVLFERNPQIEKSFEERAKDPQGGGGLSQHQQRLLQNLQKDFAGMRDIVISGSAVLGSQRDFRLWASGRITERADVEQRVPGKPSHVKGPDREIEPPYDFLQEKEISK